MKIKILKQDIDKACRLKMEAFDRGENFFGDMGCPISQAVRRVTKKKVRTGTMKIVIGKNKEFSIPDKMLSFITKFDRGNYEFCTPIEFEAIRIK